MDHDNQGGILERAKEALSNLFGGHDKTTADETPSSMTEPASTYKSGTDQDSPTGDYPTSTGAGTGVTDAGYSATGEPAASSTTEYAPEYKSGTDQDSSTGDYGATTTPVTGTTDTGPSSWDAGSTGTSAWDASTDTEVVTPTSGFDTGPGSTAGTTPATPAPTDMTQTTPETPPGRTDITPETYRATPTESRFDAGAGTGSSLSGSDTTMEPTDESGSENDTPRPASEDETLNRP